MSPKFLEGDLSPTNDGRPKKIFEKVFKLDDNKTAHKIDICVK